MSFKRFFGSATGAGVGLCWVGVAHAQSTGGGVGNLAQPIVTILQSIQQTVIGPLGISIFILGLAGLGMACLRGMIPWGWVAAWIIGACFLFGAPTIVNAIQSAIGNGG